MPPRRMNKRSSDSAFEEITDNPNKRHSTSSGDDDDVRRIRSSSTGSLNAKLRTVAIDSANMDDLIPEEGMVDYSRSRELTSEELWAKFTDDEKDDILDAFGRKNNSEKIKSGRSTRASTGVHNKAIAQFNASWEEAVQRVVRIPGFSVKQVDRLHLDVFVAGKLSKQTENNNVGAGERVEGMTNVSAYRDALNAAAEKSKSPIQESSQKHLGGNILSKVGSIQAQLELAGKKRDKEPLENENSVSSALSMGERALALSRQLGHSKGEKQVNVTQTGSVPPALPQKGPPIMLTARQRAHVTASIYEACSLALTSLQSSKMKVNAQVVSGKNKNGMIKTETVRGVMGGNGKNGIAVTLNETTNGIGGLVSKNALYMSAALEVFKGMQKRLPDMLRESELSLPLKQAVLFKVNEKGFKGVSTVFQEFLVQELNTSVSNGATTSASNSSLHQR